MYNLIKFCAMKRIISFMFVLMGTVFAYAQEKNYSYNLEKIAAFINEKTRIEEICEGKIILTLNELTKNEKCGVINNKGDIIVPFEYNTLRKMNDGMIANAIKKGPNGKNIVGIVNLTNGQFITNKYTNVWGSFDGVAVVSYDDKMALINKKGELVSTPMDSKMYTIDYFDNKYGMRLIVTKDRKKVGAYNEKGMLVIPIKYEYIWADKTDNGFKNGIAKAKLNNKIVYLKKDGTLLKTSTEIIDGKEFDGSFAFVKTAQGAGVIDTKGVFYNLEKSPEFGNLYDDIKYSHTEGLFIARNRKTNKYGFVDKYGKVIVPIEYSRVEPFILGLAQVRKDTENGTRYGYVNTKGELIVNCIYDNKRHVSEIDNDYPNEYTDSIRIVSLNDKFGYINNKGELITKIEYDELIHFFKGVGVVRKGEKYGFVNTHGELITKIEYDNVRKSKESTDGVWLVSKGGKYGYVSNKGEITSVEFDRAELFSYGLGIVRKNDRLGLVDINGNSTFDYIK